MEGGLLLDVVVRESAAVLELLASEDQALLVRGDALLVLDLGLDVVDGVGRLDLEGDGLAGDCTEVSEEGVDRSGRVRRDQEGPSPGLVNDSEGRFCPRFCREIWRPGVAQLRARRGLNRARGGSGEMEAGRLTSLDENLHGSCFDVCVARGGCGRMKPASSNFSAPRTRKF